MRLGNIRFAPRPEFHVKRRGKDLVAIIETSNSVHFWGLLAALYGNVGSEDLSHG